MNKGDLMKLIFTEDELKNVDSAIPQPWADKMREMGVQPRYFAWSYNENRIGGAPVDLAAAFLERFNEMPHLLDKAEYDRNEIGALYSAIHLVNEALGI